MGVLQVCLQLTKRPTSYNDSLNGIGRVKDMIKFLERQSKLWAHIRNSYDAEQPECGGVAVQVVRMLHAERRDKNWRGGISGTGTKVGVSCLYCT